MWLVLLCGFAPAAAQPKVISLVANKDSLKAHHTSFYRGAGFVVRRGQPFEISVETDVAIDNDKAAFAVFNDAAAEYNNPSFKVAGWQHNSEDGSNSKKYVLSISTPVTTPVGKYEHITVSVEESGKKSTYMYPFPVYVIFNPWVAEDKEVYIATEELRQEHVLNEYGNVYLGHSHMGMDVKWHYGQSNQVVLDAAFFLLKKLDRGDAADPVKVTKTIADNQGMIRDKATLKPKVGTEDALLEGNWGDFPTDDKEKFAAGKWTSSVDILKRWKELGAPAQYGQCWVFAALLNALMRAVGVGSRQVTAFEAPIDTSSKRYPDKKFHHVIDEYFDVQGNMIHRDGQVWNFHSWNEIYLSRASEATTGWHSLDGTPTLGVGPVLTESVRTLDESDADHMPLLISTVHATWRTFLVACDAQYKAGDGLAHCKVQNMMKYDHSGLRLMASSKTLANGTMVMDNVTSQFIDPARDAFFPGAIPLDNMSFDPTRRLEGDVTILLKGGYASSVRAGDNVEGIVAIDTSRLTQGEFIQIHIKFTLETFHGDLIGDLEDVRERVLVQGDAVVVPFTLDSSAYVEKDVNSRFIKLVVVGETQGQKNLFAKDTIEIVSPEVVIMSPKTVQVGSGAMAFHATFTNPHGFELKGVCVRVQSHQLKFFGQAEDITETMKCGDLPAHDVMEIQSTLVAPEAAGTYYINANVMGDYLPVANSDVEIVAVGGGAAGRFGAGAILLVCGVVVVAVAAVVGCVLYVRLRRRVAGAWPSATGNTRAELQETWTERERRGSP